VLQKDNPVFPEQNSELTPETIAAHGSSEESERNTNIVALHSKAHTLGD